MSWPNAANDWPVSSVTLGLRKPATSGGSTRILSPAAEPRYVEIKNPQKENCVIFHSDTWHRVRPVTKGVRKSLVGWILGNQFK